MRSLVRGLPLPRARLVLADTDAANLRLSGAAAAGPSFILFIPIQSSSCIRPDSACGPWFSRSYLTDLVAMGRETSSLRSHPDNVLASPLCHSSHQSTPSGVGRFPSRNVATVENSRYASRKLNELRIRFEKHDRREQALQRSADGGALTRKPGVLDTPTSSTLTTMSLIVAAASA